MRQRKLFRTLSNPLSTNPALKTRSFSDIQPHPLFLQCFSIGTVLLSIWVMGERRSYLKQLFFSPAVCQISLLFFATEYVLHFIQFRSLAVEGSINASQWVGYSSFFFAILSMIMNDSRCCYNGLKEIDRNACMLESIYPHRRVSVLRTLSSSQDFLAFALD